MINGVVFKELITHADERGFFRELIRATDDFFAAGFGQWSHSLMYTGVAKAWHIHKRQTDWWYVAGGVMKAALYDARPDSRPGKTMDLTGDNQAGGHVLPPGVRGSGPGNLFYITSHCYDPADEGRIRHDDPEIGYDWTRGPEIK